MKHPPQSLVRRRTVLGSLAALATLPLIRTARAETWPDRPIKLLVPFAAGGNIDIQGRHGSGAPQ